MGNNTSRKGQRNTQRPESRHPSQKLSRDQLIHRLETLREELEENPNLNDQRKARIQQDMSNYSQQLDKLI
jgi:molecular chaperone GrpE (heat shock protein)